MRKKILCALLAVTLLLSLSSCFLPSTSPDETAKSFMLAASKFDIAEISKYSAINIKELLLDICEKQGITEAGYCKQVSSSGNFDPTPKNLDELFEAYSDKLDELFTEEYGSDYSVVASVVSSVNLNEQEIAKVMMDISDNYDDGGIVLTDYVETSKIKECYKVEGKVYIQGSKVDSDDSNSQAMTLYIGKIGLDWKILNVAESIGFDSFF